MPWTRSLPPPSHLKVSQRAALCKSISQLWNRVVDSPTPPRPLPTPLSTSTYRRLKIPQFVRLTCVLIYAYHLISNFNGLFYHYHQTEPPGFSHLFNWRVLTIHWSRAWCTLSARGALQAMSHRVTVFYDQLISSGDSLWPFSAVSLIISLLYFFCRLCTFETRDRTPKGDLPEMCRKLHVQDERTSGITEWCMKGQRPCWDVLSACQHPHPLLPITISLCIFFFSFETADSFLR